MKRKKSKKIDFSLALIGIAFTYMLWYCLFFGCVELTVLVGTVQIVLTTILMAINEKTHFLERLGL